MNKVDQAKKSYINLVPAVEQAGRILISLADGSSALNLTEICKKTGIQKSKAYAILNTLQNLGFVRKREGTKLYSLGTSLIFLGRKASEVLSYRELTEPYLKEIARFSKSTAIFGLIEGFFLIVVAKEEGDGDFNISIKLGKRYPLTFGAHGKAIFAFLSQKEREEILRSEELYFHGSPANFDQKKLRKEVRECLEKGYAVDVGTFHPKVNALASPVFGEGNKVIGSLFIVGLFPESEIESLGFKLKESAKAISMALGASVKNF